MFGGMERCSDWPIRWFVLTPGGAGPARTAGAHHHHHRHHLGATDDGVNTADTSSITKLGSSSSSHAAQNSHHHHLVWCKAMYATFTDCVEAAWSTDSPIHQS